MLTTIRDWLTSRRRAEAEHVAELAVMSPDERRLIEEPLEDIIADEAAYERLDGIPDPDLSPRPDDVPPA